MELLSVNIFTALLIFFCIFAYYKYAFSYWYRLGIPYITPVVPFGNITQIFTRQKSLIEKLQEFYTTMKKQGHKYAGLYFLSRKVFLIIDPELAKHVLTTDFHYFHDRGLSYDEVNDPLSANLVALDGLKWKTLRTKLSPTFTSGKLKMMFPIILNCAEEMIDVLNKEELVEIKDLVSRYTTDVIGSCAFGIDCNSLENPDTEFRKIGKRAFNENYIDLLRRNFIRSFPSLAKKLKIISFTRHVTNFFMKVFVDTVTYRQENDVRRNDFLQLLLELMDKENNEDPITMNQAAAQAFVFFLAGFETSASTITFAMYELASNVDIQNRLRAEISDVLNKNDEKITYNAVMEMPYLEIFIQETLRKWPVITFLMRKSSEKYLLPGTEVSIEKGTPTIIPIYAIHRDSEYYPNPEIFDPGRFESENNKKKNESVYIPFGNGPRICIGLRFAMVQVKVALITLLSNFHFTINKKTKHPLILNQNSFNLDPLGGIWLNVLPLKKTE